MLVTEEDAKQLWCPHARVTNTLGDGGGNRWDGTSPYQAPAGSLCIGAACMAWRWSSPPFDKTLRKSSPAARGYCGLAGLATYTGNR